MMWVVNFVTPSMPRSTRVIRPVTSMTAKSWKRGILRFVRPEARCSPCMHCILCKVCRKCSTWPCSPWRCLQCIGLHMPRMCHQKPCHTWCHRCRCRIHGVHQVSGLCSSLMGLTDLIDLGDGSDVGRVTPLLRLHPATGKAARPAWCPAWCPARPAHPGQRKRRRLLRRRGWELRRGENKRGAVVFEGQITPSLRN